MEPVFSLTKTQEKGIINSTAFTSQFVMKGHFQSYFRRPWKGTIIPVSYTHLETLGRPDVFPSCSVKKELSQFQVMGLMRKK